MQLLLIYVGSSDCYLGNCFHFKPRGPAGQVRPINVTYTMLTLSAANQRYIYNANA
jgi:hypothetical protein